MEKNCADAAPHPVDAENGSTVHGGEFEKFEKFERVECPEGGPNNSSNSSNTSNPSNDIEERVRADCRRSCRRNFWIELFKSAAKIAGVVLAALGLSSFNQED